MDDPQDRNPIGSSLSLPPPPKTHPNFFVFVFFVGGGGDAGPRSGVCAAQDLARPGRTELGFGQDRCYLAPDTEVRDHRPEVQIGVPSRSRAELGQTGQPKSTPQALRSGVCVKIPALSAIFWPMCQTTPAPGLGAAIPTSP